MTECLESTRSPADVQRAAADEQRAAATWLESEFPGWTVDIDAAATWEGDLRPLWIARKEGHHPQSELTAAKLHTRLTEYLEREERRRALAN